MKAALHLAPGQRTRAGWIVRVGWRAHVLCCSRGEPSGPAHLSEGAAVDLYVGQSRPVPLLSVRIWAA